MSSLVSLVAVRQVTVRRARAERAEAARVAVRAHVTAMIDDLARYRFQRRRTAPDRKPDLGAIGDHASVVRIRAAAADLPAWRRRRVDNRCRRVFGRTWTDLAINFPTKSEGGESVGAWFALAAEHRGPEEADFGLLHRAYSEMPGHPSQDQLASELRRLAMCW